MRRARGITLPELVISSAILLVILAGVGLLIRQTATGVKTIARITPLQRETDFATRAVEFDFLGAARGSFMNALPNPGFEDDVDFLSTGTVPIPGTWVLDPYGMDPLAATNTTVGHLTKDDRLVRFGQTALVLTSYGRGFQAQSPVLTLAPGDYVFGGWINQPTGGSPRQAAITLLGDTLPVPTTVLVSTGMGTVGWSMVGASFTASAGTNYQVRLEVLANSARQTSFVFDNVFLMPLSRTLTPGSTQTIEFRRMNSHIGRFETVRYTLSAEGRLRREIVESGAVVRPAGGDVPHVTSLTVGWFGGAGFLGQGAGLPPLAVRAVCVSDQSPTETLATDLIVGPSIP